MGDEFRVIGTRPPTYGAVEKVTGAAVFGADVHLPGMLEGKVLRSPHAHARIRAVDTRAAEALAGVYAVITAADLPGPPGFGRDCLLASGKVLYAGHPIVAVAAANAHIAEEALALIRVDYEVLPPVMDVREAMRAGSPLLHEDLITRSRVAPGTVPSNVASHFRLRKGDPAHGFAEAAVVVEREFHTATVHQGYIEPHASTVAWDGDGGLCVWTCTQGAFAVRSHLAETLGLAESRIRVVPTEVGGGFGGKSRSYFDVLAALLARRAGRPVRMVMTQSEVLTASGPASGTRIRVRMGADQSGRFTAAFAELCYEAGAFPGSPVGSAAEVVFGSYDIPHVEIEGYDVVVNKPWTNSYRAPGAAQATFAVEQVVDELAGQLGLDPLELRLRNVAREGTERVDGTICHAIGAEAVLRAALAHPHYSAPLGGPCRGRGVALGYWPNWGGQSSCTINVNEDGTVSLLSGSVDMSGSRTSTAMQAAEVLGLELEQVQAVVGDTAETGYADLTVGSRTTFATGLAAIAAAKDAIRQMCARAAWVWRVPAETVSYDGAAFHSTAAPEKRLSFRELAGMLGQSGGPITGRGAVNGDEVGYGGSYAAHIVDVEVDPETGRARVLRCTVAQDVGRAVHPGHVEGQIKGALTQGIGWALYEGYVYGEDGALLNTSLLDYRLPTALDVPAVEPVIVQVPNPSHPFGVRGVGEIAIVPAPAAVANAVCRATGVRMLELPMTPASILERMGVMAGRCESSHERARCPVPLGCRAGRQAESRQKAWESEASWPHEATPASGQAGARPMDNGSASA